MSSLLPLIAREYRRKLLKRFRPEAIRDPWMRYAEIEIVEDVLRALAPRRCLEWGMGFSTLRFSALLPPEARWMSIEHDRAWYERVERMVAEAGEDRATIELRCVPPSNESWSYEERGDGSAEDFAEYIALPKAHGPFDFILVDGRARVACLEAARELVSPEGIVMLHDANRSAYHAPFGLFPHQVAFLDHRTVSGGLWIGSVGRPIESLIDVAERQAFWARASRAARLFGI